MGLVDVKSTQLQNRDAKPAILNNPLTARQDEKVGIASGDVANGDSIGSIYRLIQVQTNARIHSLLLSSDALTGAAANIGIYRTTDKGSAVVNAAFFAAAASLATAQTHVNVVNQSGNNTLAKQEQPLWQALGETENPGGYYDICITLTAASSAAGKAQIKVGFLE